MDEHATKAGESPGLRLVMLADAAAPGGCVGNVKALICSYLWKFL